MRLFLAIYPPKSFLDYFREVQRSFDKQKRNLRHVNLEQMHLTMRFVGANVSLGSKNRIVQALLQHQNQLPKPFINLSGLKFGFPGQFDPRVLMAEIAPNDELDELTSNLHRIVRHERLTDVIGWKSQADKHYHISISRLKPAATRSTGREIKQMLQIAQSLPKPPGFTATELHVVQSILTVRQPEYKKLEKVAL